MLAASRPALNQSALALLSPMNGSYGWNVSSAFRRRMSSKARSGPSLQALRTTVHGTTREAPSSEFWSGLRRIADDKELKLQRMLPERGGVADARRHRSDCYRKRVSISVAAGLGLYRETYHLMSGRLSAQSDKLSIRAVNLRWLRAPATKSIEIIHTNQCTTRVSVSATNLTPTKSMA